MNSIKIDLLRHGACQDGAIYRGHTDSLLSAEGHRQMERAVEKQQWQRIYYSPLRRCRSFAESLHDRIQCPLHVDERLKELDFGDWDGCLTSEVWDRNSAAVMAFWQDPESNAPPGGESLAQLRDRVVSFLNDVHRAHQNEHLLLVTHGGVIRTLVAYLLQIPPNVQGQLRIGYGSLSRIELFPMEDDPNQFFSEVIFTNRLPESVDYQ